MKLPALIIIALFVYTEIISAQIVNSSFEEWQTSGSHLQPIGWTLEDGFCMNGNYYVERDTDSYSGEYALKIKGVCDFWEGGLEPAIITQSIDLNNSEAPDKIRFMVKMLNIVEDNGAAVGCGWIDIRSYYEEGGSGNDFWHVISEEEISEWEEIEIPLLGIDTNKTVKRLQIRMSGGSCGNGIGYEGNSDFLVDAAEAVYTSLREVGSGHMRVYPNPAKDMVYLEGAENYKLSIFNQLGQVITIVDCEELNNSVLPLDNIPNGMLILKFVHKTKGEEYIRKIIKHGD